MTRAAHQRVTKTASLRAVLTFWLLALTAGAAGAEEASAVATDAVREGHRVAVLVCSSCHVVARDQPYSTVLSPPAPSFESIAQRSDITAQTVVSFLSTTHRGAGNPKGMPNPELTDTYAKQVAAYLLSLRKRP